MIKVNILWRGSNQDLTRKPYQYGTIGSGIYSVNYRRYDEKVMIDAGYYTLTNKRRFGALK